MHVGVGHVLAAREKVCGELRQRDEREARREHEQTAERNGQENDVEDVVAVRHRRDDREWIRHSSTKDPGRRATDLFVVPSKTGSRPRGRRARRQPGRPPSRRVRASDDRPCTATAARECVPEAERHDRERHELARPGDEHRTHRKRQQSDPSRGTRRRRAGAESPRKRGETHRARSTRSTDTRDTSARAGPPTRADPCGAAQASTRAALPARPRRPES